MLVFAGRARHAGRADKSPHAYFIRGGLAIRIEPIGSARPGRKPASEVHSQQTLFIAVEGAQALSKRSQPLRHRFTGFYGGQLPDSAPIFLEGKCDLRMRQRREREVMMNVRGFG